MQQDYYAILEISPHASTAQIKEAYRKLCFKYHPDRTREDYSQQFKAVATAYKVLSMTESRIVYNELLALKESNKTVKQDYQQLRKQHSQYVMVAGITLGLVIAVGSLIALTRYVNKPTFTPVCITQPDRDLKEIWDTVLPH